jgi:hypothetical protein
MISRSEPHIDLAPFEKIISTAEKLAKLIEDKMREKRKLKQEVKKHLKEDIKEQKSGIKEDIKLLKKAKK